MVASFHSVLRQMRNEKGISQEKVAKHLGISRLTYIQIEKGKRKPDLSELNHLADLLETTIGFLVGEQQETQITTTFQGRVKELSQQEVISPKEQKEFLPKERFEEVLLYILEKVGARPNVGETVLYKLLYFIDFDYYEKHRKSVTGLTYMKNSHGPTPVEFKKYVDQMEKEGLLTRLQNPYFRYTQKKYLPTKAVKLTYLSAEELRHIDDVLARLAIKSAKELSEYSHHDVPWIVHQPGQVISYDSVFYRSDEYSVANYDDEL